MIAEVLGPQLALPRRPIAEPGRPAPFCRVISRDESVRACCPNFSMSSTIRRRKHGTGSNCLGRYEFDYEGVVPTPLTLIEKGKLKNVPPHPSAGRGFRRSNGRARVPGAYGANAAAISNLFVSASETVKRTN